jgi:hypothetical protein
MVLVKMCTVREGLCKYLPFLARSVGYARKCEFTCPLADVGTAIKCSRVAMLPTSCSCQCLLVDYHFQRFHPFHCRSIVEHSKETMGQGKRALSLYVTCGRFRAAEAGTVPASRGVWLPAALRSLVEGTASLDFSAPRQIWNRYADHGLARARTHLVSFYS